MLNLIRRNKVFYLLFLPVFIGSSFIVASAPLALGTVGIIWFIAKARYDYIITIFLLTLILANNQSEVFIGYEQLRVVFVGVLFFLSGLIFIREKELDQRVLYFMPFFMVALISSYLYSPMMITSVFKVLSYLVVIVSIFVLIKYLMQAEEIRLYEHILLLVFLSLVVSFVGGLLYPSVFMISGRLNGVLGNPNFLGLFCILAYAYVDHFKFEESWFSKRSIYFLKGLILLCILLTGSRNAYVSIALYIVTTVFIFRGISGKSIAVFLGFAAVIGILQIETIARFLPFIGELVRPDTLGTASGRSIVWPVAIDEIHRQPWLGGGFEYYSYYISNFAREHGLVGVYWYGVWNTYLAFLLDTGVIGLTAYFYFIYKVIQKSGPWIYFLPFVTMMFFTGMFEAWAVSSLNPITPFFLIFFVIISIHGSRYENFSIA